MKATADRYAKQREAMNLAHSYKALNPKTKWAKLLKAAWTQVNARYAKAEAKKELPKDEKINIFCEIVEFRMVNALRKAQREAESKNITKTWPTIERTYTYRLNGVL